MPVAQTREALFYQVTEYPAICPSAFAQLNVVEVIQMAERAMAVTSFLRESSRSTKFSFSFEGARLDMATVLAADPPSVTLEQMERLFASAEGGAYALVNGFLGDDLLQLPLTISQTGIDFWPRTPHIVCHERYMFHFDLLAIGFQLPRKLWDYFSNALFNPIVYDTDTECTYLTQLARFSLANPILLLNTTIGWT